MALKAVVTRASSPSPRTGIWCDRSSEPNRTAPFSRSWSGVVIERYILRDSQTATIDAIIKVMKVESSCFCSRTCSEEIWVPTSRRLMV